MCPIEAVNKGKNNQSQPVQHCTGVPSHEKKPWANILKK